MPLQNILVIAVIVFTLWVFIASFGVTMLVFWDYKIRNPWVLLVMYIIVVSTVSFSCAVTLLLSGLLDLNSTTNVIIDTALAGTFVSFFIYKLADLPSPSKKSE